MEFRCQYLGIICTQESGAPNGGDDDKGTVRPGGTDRPGDDHEGEVGKPVENAVAETQDLVRAFMAGKGVGASELDGTDAGVVRWIEEARGKPYYQGRGEDEKKKISAVFPHEALKLDCFRSHEVPLIAIADQINISAALDTRPAESGKALFATLAGDTRLFTE